MQRGVNTRHNAGRRASKTSRLSNLSGDVSKRALRVVTLPEKPAVECIEPLLSLSIRDKDQTAESGVSPATGSQDTRKRLSAVHCEIGNEYGSKRGHEAQY